MKMQIVGIMAVAMSATVLTATQTELDLALLKESESIHRQYRAEPVVPDEEPVVLVIKQELPEFLKLAGRFNGYEVTFSGEVSGVLKDVTLPMKMGKLMPELSSSFDLQWHMQPSKLYVSKASIVEQKIVQMDAANYDELLTAVAKTDMNPGDYEITLQEGAQSVLITAPASYLDGILALSKKLNGTESRDD